MTLQTCAREHVTSTQVDTNGTVCTVKPVEPAAEKLTVRFMKLRNFFSISVMMEKSPLGRFSLTVVTFNWSEHRQTVKGVMCRIQKKKIDKPEISS